MRIDGAVLETLEKLAATGLRTGHLSDALDELGLPGNAAGGYRSVGAAERLTIGTAITVRQTREFEGEPVSRHRDVAASLARKGDFIVIDACGTADIATWGEAHTLRAMASGAAGVLVHGAIRDVEGIQRRGLPVFFRSRAPVRSKGRFHTASVGEPVSLAGVVISQGDIVAADKDGIVAISPGQADRVFEKALEIKAQEESRDRELERLLDLGASDDARG